MYVQVQFSAHINSSKHCSELYRRLPLLRRWLFNPFDFIIKCPVFFFFSHLAHYWIPPPTGNTQVANIIILPEALEGVRPLKSWAAWIRRSRYTMHSALPRALWSPLGSVVAPGGQPAGVCSTRVVLLRLHAMHMRLFIQATLGMADATCLRMKIKTNVVHDLMSAMRPIIPSFVCISVAPKISASRGRWFIACASLREKNFFFFFFIHLSFWKNKCWVVWLLGPQKSSMLPASLTVPRRATPATTTGGIYTIILRTSIILHNSMLQFFEMEKEALYLFKNKWTACLFSWRRNSESKFKFRLLSFFHCYYHLDLHQRSLVFWTCGTTHTHCCDYPTYPMFHFHGSLKKKIPCPQKKIGCTAKKKKNIKWATVVGGGGYYWYEGGVLQHLCPSEKLMEPFFSWAKSLVMHSPGQFITGLPFVVLWMAILYLYAKFGSLLFSSEVLLEGTRVCKVHSQAVRRVSTLQTKCERLEWSKLVGGKVDNRHILMVP